MSSRSPSQSPPGDEGEVPIPERSRLLAVASLVLLVVGLWLLVRASLPWLGDRAARDGGPAPPGAPSAGTPSPAGATGPHDPERRILFASLDLMDDGEASGPKAQAGPSAAGRDAGTADPPVFRIVARAGTPPPIERRQLEVIAGRAVGPDGRPVPEVRVEGGTWTAATAEDGRFALPRTLGAVRLEHPGFFPREIAGSQFPVGVAEASSDGTWAALLRPSDPVETLDLVLRPGSRIAGVVRDAGGKPVAAARVQFGQLESAPEVLSDPDGAYSSPLLGHGLVTVCVTHPDHQPATRLVTIPAPGRTVAADFAMEAGEKIVVRVRDPVGTPVPDASVWIRLGAASSARGPRPGAPRFGPLDEDATATPAGPSSPAEASPAAVEWRYLGRTGDLGTLETCRDPGRQASVRVSVAGFHEEVRPVLGREVEVSLREAPAVAGHAVDAATGLPRSVTGVRLLILEGTEYEETPDRGTRFATLETGRFIVGLPPREGTYRIAVESEGDYHGMSAPFRFDGRGPPPETIVRLEFRLELRGVVRTADGPIVDAEVDLLEAKDEAPESRVVFGVAVRAPPQPVETTRTGPGGRFAFAGLKPGAYRLRTRWPDHADFVSPPLTVPWDGEYPVILQKGARLEGVLRGPDGEPEPDVPIVVTHADDAARVAWTDQQGRFSVSSLRADEEYMVIVADPREGAAERPPAETAGHRVVLEEGKDLVLNLRTAAAPVGSVQGRLTFAGRPLGGIPVRLAPVGAGETPAGAADPVVTGPDGGFSWRGLSPGTYRLDAGGMLEGISLTDALLEVRAGRRATVETAIPGVSHRIDLVDATTGERMERSALVEWTPRGGTGLDRDETAAGGSPRSVRTADGRARVDGLLPGSYTVSVRVQGLLLGERVVRLDKDTEERLAVAPFRSVRVRINSLPGIPFRGPASVVVERDGREVYRDERTVDGDVSVDVAGVGRYELTVRCAAGIARTVFRIDPDHRVVKG